MGLTKLLADWGFTIPALPVDNWWFCGFVLVVMMLFMWLIARFTTSATENIDLAEIDRQMLTAVTELKSRGELTTEEYRSIKSRLVNRLGNDRTTAGSEDSSDKEQQPKEISGKTDQMSETPEGQTGSEDEIVSEHFDESED